MRQSYIAEPGKEYDGRWVGNSAEVLIEVLRTNNARDVRGCFLALAYVLENEPPDTHAVLVLTESKLSTSRLREEMARFRRIVQDHIGQRVHCITYSEDGSSIKQELSKFGDNLTKFVRDLVQHESATKGGRASRAFVQALVLDRWLLGKPLTSLTEVAHEAKASRPTVTAALDHLTALGAISGVFGDFRVNPPTPSAWISVAKDFQRDRKSVYFSDPSGLARGPQALLNRLLHSRNPQRQHGDLAVGGVIAASHVYPALNITSAPRLDLSVYDGNTSFVRKLDAGLRELKEPKSNAPLVLHFGRRLRRPLEWVDPGLDFVSPLECLVDLLDIGLEADASAFADHLSRMHIRGQGEHE